MGYDLVKPGEVIEGRYRIIRALADGGMGTVFLAEHWLIKRKVAIKILHADLVDDATMIRRFMNEALAAGTLGHPNIVESTDMGFTREDVPYIVFEYLQGTVLADEVMRVREMPVARAIKIAHQIASALDAAHAANIIHRDLKTDNIFLTERGGEPDHVKVLDFGISRFLTAADKTVAGGNLLGTPEFMAPEQIVTPEIIDHRVDIYALGVVLYEMLTGSVPFRMERQGQVATVEEAHALLDRILNDEPAPIERDDIPRSLVDLIETRLLAKVPKWRYQTMREVQSGLESCAHEVGPTALPRPARSTLPPVRTTATLTAMTDQTVSKTELSADELVREVKALGRRWALVDGDLVCQLHSRQMARLAAGVSAAAVLADELDHHPRITITAPHARLTIPSARTVLDLVYAARFEAWLRDNGW